MKDSSAEMKGHYPKMWLMLAASFVIMYAVMFLNVSEFSHVYLSITRAYMSLLMVLPMAVLMVLLMRKMLPDPRKNTIIATSAVVLFILTLVLLRSQQPIGDVQYMQAMIPHHSSAILTSERATIRDPEVKALAEKIIQSQREEIAEMKAMLARLKE